MFDECDDVYVNTFKSKISFKDLEGKSYKKITNIYNKENPIYVYYQKKKQEGKHLM